MLRKDVQIERPSRWDVPFDEQAMRTEDVDRLMSTAPFSQMNADRFPGSCSLRGILQNDTRILKFSPGDLVFREGDYGNSAFLVLRGSVRVLFEESFGQLFGTQTQQGSLLKTLWRLIFRPSVPEYRRQVTTISDRVRTRVRNNQTGLFLQDVPGLLDADQTLQINQGDFFGEVAALSRTPRSASVVADSESTLLEIRWQGLRDLMRYDHGLRDHIHTLYRENSLASHLRQTSFLQNLDDQQVESLVRGTSFETFGNFEWHRPYKQLSNATPSEKIEAEPLIAGEGNAPNGLLLIRNGFARLSQSYGNGHRTCSYLGKGQSYGLPELYSQWKTGKTVPLQYSLRAVGYVDILRIPTELVEQHVLPQLTPSEVAKLDAAILPDAPTKDVSSGSQPSSSGAVSPSATSQPKPVDDAGLETSMLEFVVENRYMNGSQTMMIDLDRCTRCDDCVRACSDTHDNNPRFVRSGPVFGRKMFASACMHCADPVCMIGCPTGAISRNEQTGSVTIHDGSCIGCATCANSCPYSAIRMVDIRDEKGRFVIDRSTQLPIAKATKCDLCTGLLGGPACERACPHDALVRIDLQTPDDLKKWLSR